MLASQEEALQTQAATCRCLQGGRSERRHDAYHHVHNAHEHRDDRRDDHPNLVKLALIAKVAVVEAIQEEEESFVYNFMVAEEAEVVKITLEEGEVDI